MPRHVVSIPDSYQNVALAPRPRSRAARLRAYPPDDVRGTVPVAALKRPLTPVQDARGIYRRKFGRALTMDWIETAIDSANQGAMQTLTDLSRETIDNDPHLGAILTKRFGAVASLPWEVHPAEGPGVDDQRALQYAALAREQLRNLPQFRQTIEQIAWGLFDGRAALEIAWLFLAAPVSSIETVRWALQGLDWIHPRRLSFGPKRELRVVPEDVAPTGNFAPIGLSLDPHDLARMNLRWKFVTFTPQLFGEYQEREGLARRCMYWSFFKRYSQRDRMYLLELFGKPWRIGKLDKDSPAGGPEIEAMDEILDGLGANHTARLPRGAALDVVSPAKGAGEVHADVIEEVDKQMSKLVLGQTGTTDPVPAGLNSSAANVMQDEQLMVLTRDAACISEVIERDITDAIIAVNFGPAELPNAPIFKLRADLPADRLAELKRLQAAQEAGLSIKIDEAYAVSGFSQPQDGDIVIRIDQPPTPPLSPVPPAPRAVVVYPTGDSPAAGEQQPPPPQASAQAGAGLTDSAATVGSADQASIITVNEARAQQGLGPLLREDGTPDPAGEMTVAAYQEWIKQGAAPRIEGGESADEEIEAVRRSIGGEAADVIALARAQVRALRGALPPSDHACCQADHRQPDGPYGSVEDVLDRGDPHLWRASSGWATTYEDAVRGLDAPHKILAALNEASRAVDLWAYARPLERMQLQSTVLGSMEIGHEIGQLDAEGKQVEAARGGAPMLLAVNVAKMAFAEATKRFRSLDIVTRAQWEDLEAAAKRRSFTVAGVENEAMLATIHDELAKQIAAGANLRQFGRFMRDRLQSAGFLTTEQAGHLTASHITTVGRTNALNAYNGGRFAHQRKPEVLRAFPVIEIQVVRDQRTRSTHLAQHGKRVLASDPWLASNYFPWGFNCRCRGKSMPATALTGVVPGSALLGIPDPGFTAGVAAFL